MCLQTDHTIFLSKEKAKEICKFVNYTNFLEISILKFGKHHRFAVCSYANKSNHFCIIQPQEKQGNHMCICVIFSKLKRVTKVGTQKEKFTHPRLVAGWWQITEFKTFSTALRCLTFCEAETQLKKVKEEI